MFHDDLLNKISASKERAHIKEVESDLSENNNKWQLMRNSGMSIVDVQEKTGASYRDIRNNTVKPLKSFFAYQWQDLRGYGYTGKEIAEMYNVSPSLVSSQTYDSESNAISRSQRRLDWARRRASGVSAKQIAKDEGVSISFVYKIAPLSADTVPASRLNLADLTKPLAITTHGELCGYYTPIERDSNAEEKDVQQ